MDVLIIYDFWGLFTRIFKYDEDIKLLHPHRFLSGKQYGILFSTRTTGMLTNRAEFVEGNLD